ncbi:Uncharacterised protein [Mycobacteroides abscessus]|nr:Uncharacterised protein [Mycobacteroides abscessus]
MPKSSNSKRHRILGMAAALAVAVVVILVIAIVVVIVRRPAESRLVRRCRLPRRRR